MGRPEHTLQRQFGLALNARRKAMRVSQAELAVIANMHRTYVGAVERGEKNVSIENMERVAAAVNTPPSVLVARGRTATPSSLIAVPAQVVDVALSL